MTKTTWIIITALSVVCVAGACAILFLLNSKDDWNLQKTEYICSDGEVFTLDKVERTDGNVLDKTFCFVVDDGKIICNEQCLELTFLEYAKYEVKVCKRKDTDNAKKITIFYVPNKDDLTANAKSIELFSNKTPTEFEIKFEAKGTNVNFNMLSFDFSVQSVAKFQNAKVVAQSVGQTKLIVKYTFSNEILFEIPIEIKEWNFAKSFSWTRESLNLIVGGDNFPLDANIYNVEYLNQNVEREQVSFEIVSGDCCEISNGKLVPLSLGNATLRAKVQSQTQLIKSDLLISVKSAIKGLQISLLLDENETTSVKSGKKANDEYTKYVLKIQANKDISNVEFELKSAYKNELDENLTQVILGDEISSMQKEIVKFYVWFDGDTDVSLQVSCVDKADNYSKQVNSQILDLTVSPYIESLKISTSSFKDENGEDYYVESVEEYGLVEYIIYNAKGDETALRQAICDKKPYYITFVANSDFEVEIVDNINQYISLKDKSAYAQNAGVQKLKFSALDGSLQTCEILVGVQNVEVENLSLSQIEDNIILYLDSENTLPISFIATPCYVTSVPSPKIEINDNFVGGPHLKVENSSIVALKAISEQIPCYIKYDGKTWKTIYVKVFESKTSPITLCDGNLNIYTNEISLTINEEMQYIVLVGGKQLENTPFQVCVRSSESDAWSNASCDEVQIESKDTIYFVLKALQVGTCQLKITMDNVSEKIFTITVADK